MGKLLRKTEIIGAAIALSLATPFALASEESLSKVWEIDFSGPPPFKRILKKLPAEGESIVLNSAAKNKAGSVWRVDFSGRPHSNADIRTR
ncbi:MAG: hypothetical protein JKY86_12605 [Gammaproteobacteria bacterium]|nr:hypothetical protein [Gammaproteobacteria bacterium]MBL4890899.1 hypothetical protein [Rhizobiaceae bacterium]